MKIVHVVAAGVMVMFLGFGSVSEAYSVPGVDRPYDPANYYSKDSISYAYSHRRLLLRCASLCKETSMTICGISRASSLAISLRDGWQT